MKLETLFNKMGYAANLGKLGSVLQDLIDHKLTDEERQKIAALPDPNAPDDAESGTEGNGETV